MSKRPSHPSLNIQGDIGALGSTAASSKYRQKVLAKYPVGYWRLGERQGPTAHDATGHGHVGTFHGTPTHHQAGVISGDPDTAIKLDGQYSYIEIPDSKDFSQPTSEHGLTVEVWMRPDILTFFSETDDPYVHWLGKGVPRHHEWTFRFYSQISKDRSNRISGLPLQSPRRTRRGCLFSGHTHGWGMDACGSLLRLRRRDEARAGVHIYKNGVKQIGSPAPGTLYNNPKWQIKPVYGAAPLRLGT